MKSTINIKADTEKQAEEIKESIIKNQEIVARLNLRFKHAKKQLRVERALIDKHSGNVTDLKTLNLAANAIEHANSILQELKIYSAILHKDVQNEV